MFRRFFLLASLVCPLVLLGASHVLAAESNSPIPGMLHMLDYVAVDYPEVVENGQVKDQSEYEEQLEFAGQVQTLAAALPEHKDRAQFQAEASTLLKLIQAKAPGNDISATALRLRQALIQAYAVATAPKQAPDLARAAALYADNCAACHGARGLGDGVQGAALEPKPANFHDRARQNQLNVFGLYNTISLGVTGTGMPGFPQISEADRWGLAFYVGSLAAEKDELARGETLWREGEGKALFPNLAALTTLTAVQAKAQHGAKGAELLAYLRAHPQALAEGAEPPLAFSARVLQDSVAAYRHGDVAQAQQLAVTAYLEGFELVESQLNTVDAELRMRIEQEMMQYRGLLKAGTAPERLDQQVKVIQTMLEEATGRLAGGAGSNATNFISSLVILLREGLEAILLVAGIAAFLTKTGRRDGLSYVHAGWISALALGVATWFAASHFITITGANRELTEGVTALVSAAVLLYVGYWLHDKSHAVAWKQYIEDKMKHALSGGTLWLLAGLSFFAVYREVFETVLFYQALWAQAAPAGAGAVLAGGATAALLLVVLAWAVARFSVRLPLRLFFGVSSAVIAVMAVVFAGKGIAALQEAGKLSVNMVNFPTIPMLGVYPHLESLLLQALVIGLIVAAYAYSNRTARRREAQVPGGIRL